MSKAMSDAIEQLRYDDEMGALIVKESDQWIVSVTSMIFNDRVLFTSRDEYPLHSAGWCYDKGGAAVFAALVWDPDTEREPVGCKKAAFDAR